MSGTFQEDDALWRLANPPRVSQDWRHAGGLRRSRAG